MLASAILVDVARSRARVFGPAHPETLRAERNLSITRAKLGLSTPFTPQLDRDDNATDS